MRSPCPFCQLDDDPSRLGDSAAMRLALDESRAVASELRRLFESRLSIGVEDYDNRVFVAGSRPLSAQALHAALRADPILRVTLPRLRLRNLVGRRPA